MVYFFYNISLIYLVVTFTIRGTFQVLGHDFVGLNHISGLSHVLLSIALIWFTIICNKAIKIDNHLLIYLNKKIRKKLN